MVVIIKKCDVWSCGVILYILLSEYPPFGEKSQKQIMSHILTKQLQFSSPILEKKLLLNKRPKERIIALEALNSAWMTNTLNSQISQL